MCVLAVDIGTTSLKAALVGRTGDVISYSKQPLAQGSKAALLWMDALKNAISALHPPMVSEHPSPLSPTHYFLPSISAICISGNGPTLVSPDGTTLLWNAAATERGVSRGGPRVPPIGGVSRGGKGSGGSIFLPRITAFLDMYGNSSRYIFSGPEYLVWRLTGNAITVLPEKRYQSAYWDDEALDSLGIPRGILPPFIAPTQQAGTLTEDAALALGLFPSPAPHALPPVFCTGPDFIAAMIGTASLEEGKVYDCAGSSEGINLVVSDEWLMRRKASLPKTVRVLPSVMPGLWNIAVLISESGSIFVNYRRIVEAVLDKEVPYSELIKKCLANKNSDGYEILQHIAENFRDGLSLLRTIYMAADDAPYSRYAVAHSAAASHCAFDTVVVTGGQAQNDEWMQMKSNISGVNLARMKCPDAELIGDAAVAWTGLGEYPALLAAVKAICKADAAGIME